jgi:CHASE3 domain sensor protein
MRKLKDFRVGTKIISGYVIALLLMAAVGGVAIYRIRQIGQVVSHLADNLAAEQHLADSLTTQSYVMRLPTLKYINDQQQMYLDSYNSELGTLYGTLATAKDRVVDPDRVELLGQLKQNVNDYNTSFASIISLMGTRNGVVKDMLESYGPIADSNTLSLHDALPISLPIPS